MDDNGSPRNLNQNISGESPLRRYGPVLIFLVGLGLLLTHSFLPNAINIDIWTVSLLMILAFLPFVADIKEVVLTPDEGFRIKKTTEELKNQVEETKKGAVEKLRHRIEELEKEDQEDQVESAINRQIGKIRTRINNIAQEASPGSAFLEVMQRLERELRELLKKEGIQDIDRAGLRELIQLTEEHDVIDRNLIIHLEDIRPLRNRIAHGERVDPSEVEQMIELGLDLLETLLYDKETTHITEETILNAIHQNPNVIEDGFEPITTHQATAYGKIDLLGEDRHGNKVVVEIKSYGVGETNLKQLIGLLETQKDEFGEETRAILVAPSVSKAVKQLSDDEISFREIDFDNLRGRNQMDLA